MKAYLEIELPKSCCECDIKSWDGEDDVCPFSGISALSIGRQDDCPLVPVPPHGRLIDADALSDIFRGFIAMYDSCPFNQLSISDKSRRDELQAALAEVINAPTIISADPAEEGKT